MSNQFDPTPGSPAASLWPDVMTRNAVHNRVGTSQGPTMTSRSASVSALSTANNSGRSSPAQLRRLLSETTNETLTSLPSTSLSSVYQTHLSTLLQIEK